MNLMHFVQQGGVFMVPLLALSVLAMAVALERALYFANLDWGGEAFRQRLLSLLGEGKQEDELLGEAVRVVFEHGQASTSMIQRRLRVGYARASRLIDIMEQKGYISGFNGSKAREVLIKRAQLEELFGDGTPLADPPVQEREPNPMSSFYRDDN